jgi:hypothetical protein
MSKLFDSLHGGKLECRGGEGWLICCEKPEEGIKVAGIMLDICDLPDVVVVAPGSSS